MRHTPIGGILFNAELVTTTDILNLQYGFFTPHYFASRLFYPYTSITGKDWEVVHRNNSGIPNNPWKGEPSPELDAAWKSIWMIGDNTYSEDEIRKVGKDPAGVAQWPPEFGGGYVAKMEVFHQLHCLNTLRQALSPEYYGADTPPRGHVVHCIEKLREALMCFSDTTVKTYIWIEDSPNVQPDFSMRLHCRNFDEVREFSRRRAMTMEAQKAMKKSDTNIIWPKLPD
ncbi:hypothetical protein G7Y89_g1077 [Cudoniella acicularis]|uniref:Cyclochlorotine biosynthesis protein O n=1 Tax=Cudoniella acicularis TaxID=354080 RepID=A0A8H4RXZ8_9HELO|nr:hypothetical protein G7Y89_g1077 [Cudoniella acicularis]